jgi:hypothetical protein
MKQLIGLLLFSAAAFAQFQNVPGTAYPALESVLNAKPAVQVSVLAASGNCTAGKDWWSNTALGDVYYCTATNTWTKVFSANGTLFSAVVIGPKTIGAGASQLPAAASGNTNWMTTVTDAASASDCTVGSGTAKALCISNGTAWVPLSYDGGVPPTSAAFVGTNSAHQLVASSTLTDDGTNLNVIGRNLSVGQPLLASSTTPGGWNSISGSRYLLRDFDGAASGIASGALDFVFVGDSWANNEYITGPLRTKIQALYGNAGCGYVNLDEWSQSPNCATRTTVGTWTDTHGLPTSLGVNDADTMSVDVTIPATKTVVSTATEMDVLYSKQPNGASFSWAVDSGGETTINTNNPTLARGKVAITGLSAASHSLVLKIKTATGPSLINWSEPLCQGNQMGICSAGVTNANFTENGLSNGAHVVATSGITELAKYTVTALQTGTAYNISFYIVMDDGNAPNPAEGTSSGDFAVVIDNGFTSAPTVTQISGSLYRINANKTTAGSLLNSQCGINRYTGQGGRGFRVTGFMIVTGSSMPSYLKSAGGGVMLFGVNCLNGTVGARVHRISNGGTLAANYAAVNAANWQAALAELTPNTVLFEFGVNEIIANATPASQATALSTLNGWVKTAMPNADVMFHPPVDIGLTGTYVMAQYANSQMALAASLGAGYFDSGYSLGTYAQSSARSEWVNTSHVNAKGGGVIANNLYKWLTQTAQ